MASLLWHLGRGSQGPVDIGSAPTGVATETQESVQKKMNVSVSFDTLIIIVNSNKKTIDSGG